MNVRMDRLEQVLQETIELEDLAELDIEYYGLEELRKRFEIFDNVKNEAFQIENDNELSSEQKARIDRITDIAYENANKFNVIIEKKEAEYLELGKRRIEVSRQIKDLEKAIEKDTNIASVQMAEGHEMPASLAKLQEDARKRIEENELALNDLMVEKSHIMQRMRELKYGGIPKNMTVDRTPVEPTHDGPEGPGKGGPEGPVNDGPGPEGPDGPGGPGGNGPVDIGDPIPPIPPEGPDGPGPEEPEPDEPERPKVKSNKPKVTWKTILHVAAGIGLGAAVFFTAGPLGVGVMSLAGGIANKFINKRRKEIAELNRLGLQSKINTVVEPRPGLKGLVDRVKNKFRTEEGLRDMSWMINSAIITGGTLTVASTVHNLIQAHNAATPAAVEPTPNPEPAPNITNPNPTVTPPQPTPTVTTPQPTPTVDSVSQYDGIRIGSEVGDYNVSVGHISSDRAVMGIETKPLLSQYVNGDSIFGRFAAVNPDGSIGQVINTNGLSIEEFCAANGIDPSSVAVSVMDKAGRDQAWISASELVSGMGGPTL